MRSGKLVVMLLLLVSSTITNSAEILKLDEVVVTANKMEENLQDIPAAITVISDTEVEEKGIENIVDITKQIPNLSESNFYYQTQHAINIRGINQSIFTSTNPVVIYSDGVPQNSSYDYGVMLQNIKRIEVLRGPQGTLYGKDSIGGVINIISKEPDNEWSGNVGLEYGSNNYLQGKFAANGALVDDTLFLNIGMVSNQDDGWITNDYDGSNADDSKEFKLNTTLTFIPNDRLTTSLTLGAKNMKSHFPNIIYDPTFTRTRDDIKHSNFDAPYTTDTKAFSQALNIKYAFNGVDFSSLTTHKNTDGSGIYDIDRSYDPANKANMNGLYTYADFDLDEWSQEFKLSSNNRSTPLRWVAGAYFSKEQRKFKSQGYQYYYKKALERDVPSDTNAKTMAVFGQTSYDVTDALTLTLGGRYQKINSSIVLTQYNFPVGTGHSSSFKTFSSSDYASWSAFLPKAALSYAINDGTNVYLSYTKGYLPGGFNFYPNTADDKLKFDAQTADSYEVGARGNFLDNQLTSGITVFYMDIDDIHLYDYGYNSAGVIYPIVSNGGKARSTGIELDNTYHINDNWTLNAAFGFTKAEYTDHIIKKYNGNTVSMTPKYTANAGIAYFHPQGFYGRLDANAQGSVYFDDANQYKQGAWVTEDIKLGYSNDDFNIYTYVKNIADESHVENYRNRFLKVNDPRKIGIGMKYSF